MAEFVKALAAGLQGVFTWPEFGMMVLGSLVGFAVGILPGIGGAATLAIMLPFVATTRPEYALALLVSMVAVVTTTGDITSILFGVPGEGTTASTVVDGYPMAQRGEATRALAGAITGSVVGAVFGALTLALAIPFVRPLVLSIGSPEMLMLSLLGICFLSVLSRGNPLKGLMSGALGLFLATIGTDSISGTPRYTFDVLFLSDGIGLLPVALGLFAIPEVVALAADGKNAIARRAADESSGAWDGVRDVFRHRWLVLRCSAIGTYVGLIPGMGASISQWIAYAHSVQSSPKRERFGRGAVEGVLGPAAANNSTLGGALVPTLGFGLPGSLSTTILLGALVNQGIVPGPRMLTPEAQGGHLTLTFSLVWFIIISNVLAAGACFLILRRLARLTHIRGDLLFPFLMSLVYLGALTDKSALEDLAVVSAIGIVGCVMKRLEWPRPPLLLGLVLGPLAENKLFITNNLYGAAWLVRPGVIFISALILIGLLYPVFRSWKQSRSSPAMPSLEPAETREAPPQAISTATFCLFLAAVATAALWLGRTFDFRTGLFPRSASLLLLAMATFQFVLLVLKKKGSSLPAHNEPESGIGSVHRPPGKAAVSLWVLGYLCAIWLLGFTIATPLFTFLFLVLGAKERWGYSLLLTAASIAFFNGLMVRVLGVPFPVGVLLFS